jgi:hypothetical protein
MTADLEGAPRNKFAAGVRRPLVGRYEIARVREELAGYPVVTRDESPPGVVHVQVREGYGLKV